MNEWTIKEKNKGFHKRIGSLSGKWQQKEGDVMRRHRKNLKNATPDGVCADFSMLWLHNGGGGVWWWRRQSAAPLLLCAAAVWQHLCWTSPPHFIRLRGKKKTCVVCRKPGIAGTGWNTLFLFVGFYRNLAIKLTKRRSHKTFFTI